MKLRIAAVFRFTTIACLMAPLPSLALDAAQIMKASDDVYRKAFATAHVKVQLSSCKYVVNNGAMSCKEKPRVTVLEAAEKKWGKDKRDARAISFVLLPVGDKGVGMLTHEYADVDRENDVLLYLPALEKVRRVVAGSDGNEDGGSFFGSEFFVDDTSLKKVDDFIYTFVRDDVQDGRPVWVIESVPTERRLKKTQYGKLHSYVDKERKLILREDIFNRSGKLYRQRLNRGFAQIQNVWLAKQQSMNNLENNRISIIQNISATYHKEVPDELLTERSLTDFTYKERILETLRGSAK